MKEFAQEFPPPIVNEQLPGEIKQLTAKVEASTCETFMTNNEESAKLQKNNGQEQENDL